MNVDFVGAGWTFPLRLDPTGGVALVGRGEDVDRAIRLILSTGVGERPMRPEFGCGIHEYVFAPIDANTAGRIAHEVRASLDRWEPRIDVLDVVVTTPSEELGAMGELHIDITYELLATNDTRNLVFPFYVIPEEDA